jgi:hypothetical protein
VVGVGSDCTLHHKKGCFYGPPPPPNNCKFIKVLNCGEFGKFVVINGCSQLKAAKMGDNGKYLS